ncbi:MAG: cytidylate kinase-like family protein [Bacteroidales bacterium]|nr:cytidylate kinase-like family protein [Bacteroidales bacterium]
MNTKEQFVITISRELGSGGRTVGRKLAEKLEVRYSDKELIKALRDKFNLTPSGIERLKGEKKSWLADFIKIAAPYPKADVFNDNNTVLEYRPDVTTDDVFTAEKEILTELAAESSCVIAGRSGFFVFKDHPNKLDVFITASRGNRIRRVMAKQGLNEELAAETIDKVDAQRDNYVKRYTGKSRYDARNYDLCLNADNHSEDELVDIILKYIGN